MSKISDLSDGGVIQGGDTLIAVRSGGNVKVTYGGSTTANIDGGTIDGTVIGGTTPAAGSFTTGSFTGNVTFGDNDKAIFGASDDLAIYSTGANGFIENEVGLLILKNNSDDRDIALQSDDGSGGIANYLLADGSTGALKAYHYGSEKLATTATGIDVTGTATVDGLTVDGAGDLGTIGNGAFNTAAALGFQSDRAFFGYSSSQNALIQSGASKGVVVEVNSDTLDGGTRAALFASNGDISFYEDTGTTAKFFWDASAEALGIGTSSPQASIHTTGDAIIGTATSGASYEGVLQIADGAVNGRTAVLIYNNHPDQFMKLGQDVNTAFIGRDQADEFAIGLFDNAADTTMTKQFVIDASGNVGIGASSPTNPLHVATASTDVAKFATTGAYNFITLDSATRNWALSVGSTFSIYDSTAASTRASVDSSGNLLVGTTTTAAGNEGMVYFNGSSLRVTRDSDEPLNLDRLTSDGDIAVFKKDGTSVGSVGTWDQAGSSRISMTNPNGNGFGIFRDSSTVAQIVPMNTAGNGDAAHSLGRSDYRWKDLFLSGSVIASGTPSSSVVGVRVNNSGNNFDLINTSCGSATTTKTHILFTNGNGNVGSIQTNGSATSYNTSSDYRLKENVVAMSGATTRLKQLAPKRFNFIADADVTVDGFLAHEVADVVPEAITGTYNEVDDDGNPVYQGIDQSKLVPLLVATIQELEARITQLETN